MSPGQRVGGALLGAAASVLGHPAAVFGFNLLFVGFFGWAERVEANTYRPAPLWLFFALLAAVAAGRFAFFRFVHRARSARGRQLLDRAYWHAELIWFGIVPFTLAFCAGVEGNLFGFFVFPLFMASAVTCFMVRRSLLRRNLEQAYQAGALQ